MARGAAPALERCLVLVEKDFKLRYNPALDGLRGVAILLVILSHSHAPLFDGAFFGVDLFFVLSGYLITSLLLMENDSEGRIGFWRFYRRRFFRLMPALALFLAAYCIFAPMLWPELTDIYTDALVSILYLADYGIALLWALSWLWRVYWVDQGQHFYEIFFRFDTRASGLFAGALLAALMIERPDFIAALKARMHHAMWVPLAVPLLMALQWDNQDAMVWGITVVECAAVVLLVAVSQGSGLVYDMLSSPTLVKLGRLSYGVYLWHYPVVRYLRADFSWPVVVVAGLAISVALSALSFYTIERWALRMRDGQGKDGGRQPQRPQPA
jgi:peptidoglycan/LPS O-acetylase OafA/YrhL